MNFSKLITYLLFLIGTTSISQVRFTLNIVVLNMDDKTPIDSCPVILKTDKGHLLRLKTNKYGLAMYINDTLNFTRAEVYTQTTRCLRTATAPLGFLASDDRFKIDLGNKKNGEEADLTHFFYLKPLIWEWAPPRFQFKFNSVDIDSLNDPHWRDTLPCEGTSRNRVASLVKVLKENPGLIMELDGHASTDEKFPDDLSVLRAEKIKLFLMQLGVNEKRLVAKGYGTKKLRISEEQIRKAKSAEEKQSLHALNRRCTMKILSWDFVEEKPKGQ